MADPVDLDAALRVALAAAQQAVTLARTMALGEIRTKRHAADVVTDVDVATERAVRSLVAEAFPDHHVVGEELGGEAWDGPRTRSVRRCPARCCRRAALVAGVTAYCAPCERARTAG